MAIVAPFAEALDDDLGRLIVVRVIRLESVRQHEVVQVVPAAVADDAVVCPVVLDSGGGAVEVVVRLGAP